MSVFVRVYTVTWYSGRYKFSGFLRLRKWMKIIPTVSSNIYNNANVAKLWKEKSNKRLYFSEQWSWNSLYTFLRCLTSPFVWSCQRHVHRTDTLHIWTRCATRDRKMRTSISSYSLLLKTSRICKLWQIASLNPPQHLPSVNKMAQVHFKWLLGNTDLYLTAQWWFVCVGHGLKSSGRACLTLCPSSPASQL
jgi:hypothetical protein